MATVITMPKFGLTMTEGTLSQWNKKVGERVEQGEALFEVATDKITNEVEAPQGGILRYIFTEDGTTVNVGKPLAIIADETEDITQYLTSENHEIESEKEGPTELEERRGGPSKDTFAGSVIGSTPYAKKLAREQGIDIQKVMPSGPNGIIVSRDIERVEQASNTPAISPLARKYAEENEVDWRSIQQEKRILTPDLIKQQVQSQAIQNKTSREESVQPFTSKPLTGMRKVIAERMSRNWQQIPHVTLSREVDVTALLKAKETLVKAANGTKLSLTHILIKIVAQALKQHPVLNAWLVDNEILYHQEVNMGIAVSVPEGLIVPVLKQVNQKGILDVAASMSELTARAKEQKLKLDETQGATFTISNLGMMGVDQFTPIINAPETGILGVGRIVDKPVFINDECVRRSFMTLSLSFDHRVLDGAEAANFLQTIDYYINEPLSLLL